MSFGRFVFDPEHGGGILWLKGGDDPNSRSASRFFAGPDSEDKEGGQCSIFRSGTELLRQYTTSLFEGRFRAFGALDGGAARVALLETGARRDDLRRTGYLLLRSAVSDEPVTRDLVRLGARGTSTAEYAQMGDIQVLDGDGIRIRLWITDEHAGQLQLSGRHTALARLSGYREGGSLRLYSSWVRPPPKPGDPHPDLGAIAATERLVGILEGVPVDGTDRKRGHLLLYDTHPAGDPTATQVPGVELGIDDSGGRMRLRGSERTVDLDQAGLVVGAGATGLDVYRGFTPKATLGIDPDGRGGFLELRGLDSTGTPRTLTIDVDGIQTDGLKVNNFVMDHPQDKGKQIYYCVLEGPEAGVYVRGTAQLAGGSALVSLPDHFKHVASPSGLTAHLSPRSALSRGVAATHVNPESLRIEELFGGLGSYPVDYIVHGVRAGHERYEVIRARRARTPPLRTAGTGG